MKELMINSRFPFTTKKYLIYFHNYWFLINWKKGLFEESHGIISNEMYDPDMNETFSMGVAQSQTLKWYGQNPLTGS